MKRLKILEEHMNINFCGTNSTISLSKSTNIFANNLVNFSNGDLVVDEIRGYLYFNIATSSWVFCGRQQNKFNYFKNLVIVLESPHKDEYSSQGIPLRPVNGITGLKINNKLADIINSKPPVGINQNDVYCVWLVNAIQYQTSCHFQLSSFVGYSKIWHTLRNQVFKHLWKNESSYHLQQNLIARIGLIKPTLIMNCVTGGKAPNGLRSMVELVINSGNTYKHPSSW